MGEGEGGVSEEKVMGHAVAHQHPSSRIGARPARGAYPAYVREALCGLTPAQKRYVKDGAVHGDPKLQTIRALTDKALFFLFIDSPNGRCGHFRLTPLGETVRRILNGDGATVAREFEERDRAFAESMVEMRRGLARVTFGDGASSRHDGSEPPQRHEP